MEQLTPKQRRELQEAIECIGYQLLRIEEQLAAIGERLGVELAPKPAPKLVDFDFDPSAHWN